jgi:hypothetical protein
MNAFVEPFSGRLDRIRTAVNGLLHLLMAIEVAWFGVLLLMASNPRRCDGLYVRTDFLEGA